MIGRPKAARRTRSRQPGFDGLESRTLLAGDVTVEIVRGSAIIVGDRLSNSIAIDQAGLDANQFRITGTDSTLIRITGTGSSPINKLTSVVVTATRDLQIDLGDGGDIATLTGVVVARDLTITTGDSTGDVAGNEVLIDSSVIGRDVTVTNGDATGDAAGNAVFITFSDIGRDLRITTGDVTGDDAFNEIVIEFSRIGREVTIPPPWPRPRTLPRPVSV
jgi:hypothetical protein